MHAQFGRQRSLQGHGAQSEIDAGLFLILGDEGFELEADLVIAGGKLAGELMVHLPAVLPFVFLLQQHLIVEFHRELHAARIEVEGPGHIGFEQQSIPAGLRGLEGAREDGGLVETDIPAVDPAIRRLEFRSIRPLLVDHAGHDGHGVGHDDLGGVHVFFEQQRGRGQHIADVVEAVAGVVGREFFKGAELDPHEVADGVLVFDAVQATQGDAAGIGVGGIDPEDVGLDPALDERQFGCRGLILPGGGHDFRAEVAEDIEPEAGVGDPVGVGLETIEDDVALVGAIGVTVVAVFFQQGLDPGSEIGLTGEGNSGCGDAAQQGGEPTGEVPGDACHHSCGVLCWIRAFCQCWRGCEGIGLPWGLTGGNGPFPSPGVSRCR